MCEYCNNQRNYSTAIEQAVVQLLGKECVCHKFALTTSRHKDTIHITLESNEAGWASLNQSDYPRVIIDFDLKARFCPMCGKSLIV